MKKALVLGGTRFFGVHLVNGLLEKGFDVTVATRGKTTDPFGDKVRRIQVDRKDKQSMKEAFRDEKWNIIYDQICFSSKEAMDAVDVFRNNAERYIFTSSLSVYDMKEDNTPLVEGDFDPYSVQLKMAESDELSYQEGKQQAEALFFHEDVFPVTAVRFPIVLGENDYTGRLETYIRKVKNDEGIYLLNRKAEMNFISEQEAGNFLAWLADNELSGAVNACANGTVSLEKLMDYIAEATGKEVTYTDKETESPYNVPKTWIMSNEKAKKSGFAFSDLHDWLPELIRNIEREL